MSVKKKEQSNEVVVQKTGGVVATYDYGKMAGEGFEEVKGTDLAIPFVNVIQPLSKAVEDSGATAGQLFNTVTGELIDGEEGINFIPCHKELAFVEWIPRDKGGGFVGLHAEDSEIVKAAIEANGGKRIGKLKVGENDLIETHYVYGLILNKDGTQQDGFAVIAFTSTKIKVFRNWLTAMYTIKGRPPMFANRATIKTIKQKNKIHTFYNLKIDPLKETWGASLINPATEANLLQAAQDFKGMVTSGLARAAFDTQDATDATSSGEVDETSKKDAPF
jgi:hypothetical protein